MISLMISLYCSNWFIPEHCEQKIITCIEKNIERGDIEEVAYYCIDETDGGEDGV